MNKMKKILIPAFIVAVIAIVSTVYTYIIQINHVVDDNTMLNMQEVSMHDLQNIQSYLNEEWSELENIVARFKAHDINTQDELVEHLNLENSSNEFSHIYMLDDQGNLYTDKHVIYDSTGHDFSQYMERGEDRVVVRYDDKGHFMDLQQEMILYAVKLKDCSADNINFVGIFGLIDIGSIQNRLKIDSFDGRGFSSIIDEDGNYIVNLEKTSSMNQRPNFFEQLQEGEVQDDIDIDTLKERSSHDKSYFFRFVNAVGTDSVIAFQSIQGTQWYFLMEVPRQVFQEKSQRFINMSVIMLIIVLVIIVLMVVLLIISNRRVAAARADAKARSEFLSNMSHEIRTPLNGLVGLNHLMKVHINDKHKVQEYVDKSSSITQYLLSLVNDILDMSKLQTGKVDIVEEPVNLEDIMNAVCTMQRENISQRGVEFIVNKSIQEPYIIGDEVHIKQILMNIVGNAAKFTPKGGKITLSITQKRLDDSHVTSTFTIEDTGIGMSAEFQKHIFESFSQERNRISSSIKGTGLGMSISYLLVQAMGGEISVKSELNKGSHFTVVLHSEIATGEKEDLQIGQEQVMQATSSETSTGSQSTTGSGDTESSETSSASEASAAPEKTFTILLAEDNEINAGILVEILEEQGFKVTHASNGQEAVDFFAASAMNEFDVILMDVQMPVMDGLHASRKIRELSRPDAKEILIFACTANTFKEDRDNALASGMNDFLAKPIDVQVLLQKLSKL